MATKFHKNTPLAIAAMMVLLCWQSSVQAQLETITFSRLSGSESMVDMIEFVSGDTDNEIAIDQLGAVAAIIQNNDAFGSELFLSTPDSSIDRVGFVGIGELLTFGDNPSFASDFLDLTSAAAIGDEVYVGFESGGNVGYFNVSFDTVSDSIFYSSGVFGSGGESLIVAIPEPSAILLLTIAGGIAAIRRRRS